MANISVGALALSKNPSDMTLVRPKKKTAVLQTYAGVAYFAWPASVVGEVVEAVWNTLSIADFDALDVMYVADAVVVFALNDGSGRSYNVNLLALDGKYYIGADDTVLRREVILRLLIMSEVA